MKRYIRSSEIIKNKKIQPGMYWISDGFMKTCISRSGNTCRIQEEWINEDTGKDMKIAGTYNIAETDSGEEFAYCREYKEYALSDDESKNWWSRLYASGAANYPWDYDDSNEYSEDNYEMNGSDDPYLDDHYTPSAIAGDYGPGNPWDAPGMSIHDFI